MYLCSGLWTTWLCFKVLYQLWEASWWPHGQRSHPWIEWSGYEPWPGILLLSQCLSLPSCVNGYHAGGNPAMDLHPIQEGVEILLVDPCYRNRDQLWPDGPLGLYADLTFLSIILIDFFIFFTSDTMPTRRRPLRWTPDIHWSKSCSKEWRQTKKTKLLKILPVYSLKLLLWGQGT